MVKGVDHIGVCVVFICHDGKGKYLLSKRTQRARDEHGKWDVGGGGVNFGEPVIKALKREIKEEYCSEIIEFEWLGYRDVHRKDEVGRKTHWLALDFKVRIDPKTVKNGEPLKNEEPRWFELSKFPAPMHSQWKNFYSLYKESLEK
jgi:8-oxo-dGTP diphosphatase